MEGAYQGEIVEVGSPSARPVLDVMRVGESAIRAAGESAASVPRLQDPPQSGGDRSRLAADVEHVAVGVFVNGNDAGVGADADSRAA